MNANVSLRSLMGGMLARGMEAVGGGWFGVLIVLDRVSSILR